MSSSDQAYNELKNAHLNTYIEAAERIMYAMRSRSTFNYAISLIASLLCTVTIEHKEEYAWLFNAQKKAIEDREGFIHHFDYNVNETVRLHTELMRFLNKTYFNELRAFRFQNPKGGRFG